MAILSRIIQLFKADIHGVMDQIEDQGLLLKQHLRDMEESLTAKEMKLKKMRSALDQARQDYQKGERETDNLEQELQVAIKKDRDDIARMLIGKLKPLNRLQSDRRNHIDRLSHEIDQFKAHYDQQRIQYEQLRQKATEYCLRHQLAFGFASSARKKLNWSFFKEKKQSKEVWYDKKLGQADKIDNRLGTDRRTFLHAAVHRVQFFSVLAGWPAPDALGIARRIRSVSRTLVFNSARVNCSALFVAVYRRHFFQINAFLFIFSASGAGLD